ncbi:MAG: NAD(P)(+) transhydrogenase (Re/Si-specific) subunit beta [Immundisolibacteraceae bacterium]|nr:NAD(P)(+) transhydrogenase (Re/Si-specific) subunit beta [Immundisolibacteraceae bacterium]
MSTDLLATAYLLSAVLFIFGIKGLASPKTARRGNLLAMAGMGLAVLAVLSSPDISQYSWIIAGIVGGAVIGSVLALKVQMTAMPQLVAMFNSLVGLAAVLIALVSFINHGANAAHYSALFMTELAIGSIVGAITFTGSLVAFGKLQGIVSSSAVSFPGRHFFNLLLLTGMVALSVYFAIDQSLWIWAAITGIAALLGILLVISIGGADMPVVVSVLNCYSGWAAAITGFTLNNELMIITGALVGASGAILSYIMCRAMNRSIVNVLIGGFGQTAADSSAVDLGDRSVKAAAPADAAFMMENGNKVIIVPGYGMAVAQAQHAVSELVDLLIKRQVTVKFAIHPVAGRMPGHMNVLLAEADISYDLVFEMDEINAEFATADVALVIGANDVINPAARSDKNSPIYGMPILDVDRAQQVFVIKRSMSPGYAGVDNSLFYQDNCSLVFGDAKQVCEAILQAID